MTKQRVRPPDDIQEVIGLIGSGRLFAVEDWIENGRRIRWPEIEKSEGCPLFAAAKSGFHSMVDVLLRARGWEQRELDRALNHAMSQGRLDLVDLFLAHGARVSILDFVDVCRTMNLELMERFLRVGVDPAKENAFACALDEMKARPLLKFHRGMRTEFPALDDQASLALSIAVQEGKVRWAALLAWAGADPFRIVPDDLYSAFPGPDDYGTCAAHSACYADDGQLVKVLKLKPTAEQAQELLTCAASHACPHVLRELLRIVPRDHLNHRGESGRTALDSMISRRSYPSGFSTGVDRNRWALECLEVLLDQGVRWEPTREILGDARHALLEHDSRYVVSVVRLLLFTPDACRPETVKELCRTPVMRRKIYESDRLLSKDLDAL